VRRLARMFTAWRDRWEQRRDLEDIDDHLLRDLGLDRAAAAAEASRPFWSGDARVQAPGRSGGGPVITRSSAAFHGLERGG
jgi:uncharacterized protein YjiS (DUF1127 family)